MSNTTTSPNMSLPVPTVSEDPGPDWATNIDACLSIIDSHNHSSGSGVQITPSGLNINTDLSFSANNATQLRSSRFSAQNSPLAGSNDIGCLYETGVDLYYNDGAGNQIRITSGGAVAGASGTITGLPSGTASASYATGQFTFQSATNTPAYLSCGPIFLQRNDPGSFDIQLIPNAAQSGNYTLAFPIALPAALNYMTLDSAGNISYNSSGVTGSGAVALATSPSLTTPTFAGLSAIPGGTIGGGTQTFTNLTSTPVALANVDWFFGGDAWVINWRIKNTVANKQGVFSITAGINGGVTYVYNVGTQSNCSVALSGTGNSIWTITGLGDSNTYTMTWSTTQPGAAVNNTIASSATATINLSGIAFNF